MASERVIEIANRCLEVADDPDETTVTRMCGGDEKLRTQVQSFLDDKQAGELMLHHLSQTFLGSASREVGATVAGYTLQRKLAAGGFGEVWLGQQDDEASTFVIKFADSAVARNVLANEARALKALRGLDAVQRYIDSGELGSTSYLVTDYVPGPMLANVLGEDALKYDTKKATEWVEQIIGTVCEMHFLADSPDRGIAHGDITPRNIIISPRTGPVLIDFGSAFRARHEISASETHHGADDVSVQTRPAGHTPAYRVPEVMYGLGSDRSSDVYQLGLLAFEIFTRQRYTDVCEQDGEAAAWKTLANLIGQRRTKVIRKALAWKPSSRYSDARELRSAWHTSVRGSHNRYLFVVLAVALPLAAGLLAWMPTIQNDDTAPAIQPNSDLPDRPFAFDWTADPERDYIQVVEVATRNYLNYDRVTDLSPKRYSERKTKQLLEAVAAVEGWLDHHATAKNRRIPQCRQLQSWLDNAKRPQTIPIWLVVTGSDSPSTAVVSINGRSVFEEEIESSEPGTAPVRLVDVEAHLHDVMRIELRDAEGAMYWSGVFVGTMAFHRSKLPNALGILFDQDQLHVGGRVEIELDPPPIHRSHRKPM